MLATRLRMAASGLVVPVEELFPGWVADGPPIRWSTNPELFTLNGMHVVTDDGVPALRLTDEFTDGSALTTRSDIAAARVTASWRASTIGLNIQNVQHSVVARDVDGTAHLRVDRNFGDGGASSLTPVVRTSSSDQNYSVFGGDGFMDNTSQTVHRTTVGDFFWDVMRAKSWRATDTEPDWKGKLRSRPISGFGGEATTNSADNPAETGRAGIHALYGSATYEIEVQPLKRSDAGLFINSGIDPALLDSSGRPFGWFYDPGFDDRTDIGLCDIVSIGGVPFLHVARDTAGSNGGGPMWQQSLYITTTTNNTSYTRDRPVPTVGAAFPTTLHWRALVQMDNIANSNPGSPLLSFRQVDYYYDGAGTAQNIGQTDYYPALGPNDGLGSCGLTPLSGTLPIHSNADIVRLDAAFGLHDQYATGDGYCRVDFELV